MKTEPLKYEIKCDHCGETFLADNLMGHRGNTKGCWKCREDIETENRANAD